MSALVRLLLLLVLCVPAIAQGFGDLPLANVTFVAPTLAPDGNFANETVAGVERMVFEEVAPGKDATTDKVRAYLEKSAAWDLVRRLYGYAWKRTRASGSGELVLAVTDTFGPVGPSHAGLAVLVKRTDGTQVPAGSFLIVTDVHAPPSGTDGPDLTIDTLIQNDYLALALAHESGHQVMWDRYGAKAFPRNLSQSKVGHDVHQITDPALAFSEGWAEAFEAIVGDFLENVGKMPVTQHPAMKLLVDRRHELIERDRYIYEDHLKKTGHMKSGLQLVATEGVAAFLIYQTYANRIFRAKGQPDAFGDVLDTLGHHQPRDLMEFWQCTLKDAPQVKDKLIRIFLEGTRYGTVSAAAPSKYFAMWDAKRASLKLPKGHPGKEDADKDAYELETSWTTWKEQLFAQAVKSGRLDNALPPGLDPLWLDHGIRRVGLNVATPEELAQFRAVMLGEREDHLLRATEFVDTRDAAAGPGFFASIDAVEKLVTADELKALRTARQEFEANRAAEAAEAGVSAYLKHRGSHAIHAALARMLARR